MGIRVRRRTLSTAEARRVALAAQGFGRTRDAPTDAGHLKRTVGRLGLLQIDSVNVLARAHYLPLFSRLGAYDSGQLDRLAWGRRSQRALFEFWAHEASLLPLAMHPLLRWRMQRASEDSGDGKSKLHEFRRAKATYIEEVRREIADRGPLAAADLGNPGDRRGPWWGWSDGKLALEWLFFAGVVTTATRRGNFERVYDLAERVLPAWVQSLPTPDAEAAQRALLHHAGQAMGVASERDLRDYFRLRPAETRARLAELVEAGALARVEVEGWPEPGYLDPGASIPRDLETRALLAPFDPLIWERARTERLFGFHYRLEIYTPVEKRKHGYYVLPFLLGDRLAARVDLKADRAGATLIVQAAHLEPGNEAAVVAPPLHEELKLMAGWLGLDRISLPRNGGLAKAMARMR